MSTNPSNSPRFTSLASQNLRRRTSTVEVQWSIFKSEKRTEELAILEDRSLRKLMNERKEMMILAVQNRPFYSLRL